MEVNQRVQPSALSQVVHAGSGRVLRTTPVYDTYWRFAAARQSLFVRRISGAPPPWTADPVIAAYRFTNAYRAADRVSQYLIREVIYTGSTAADDVFLRTMLFKLFNRIETWNLLVATLGEPPSARTFSVERYARVFDQAMASGRTLYTAAYIMPSPPFGHARKHRNHLELLDRMMRDGAPRRLGRTRSLREVFEVMRAYPSLGDFLAFQFAIDLNYSELTDFSEMEFVVAGPGARSGIRKCFSDVAGLSDAEVITLMAERAEEELDRLGLRFEKLGGDRPLQLIDCQNLFCETDKYARVVHPEFAGASGRTRIKQKFVVNARPVPQFYPPKWGLRVAPARSRRTPTSAQTELDLTPAAE